MYYKVIKDGRIIDVLDHLTYLKWQPKHEVMVLSSEDDAQAMAEYLAGQAESDLVVTPRNIDELVAGLSDMLALAINSALQPSYSIDELTHYLH